MPDIFGEAAARDKANAYGTAAPPSGNGVFYDAAARDKATVDSGGSLGGSTPGQPGAGAPTREELYATATLNALNAGSPVPEVQVNEYGHTRMVTPGVESSYNGNWAAPSAAQQANPPAQNWTSGNQGGPGVAYEAPPPAPTPEQPPQQPQNNGMYGGAPAWPQPQPGQPPSFATGWGMYGGYNDPWGGYAGGQQPPQGGGYGGSNWGAPPPAWGGYGGGWGGGYGGQQPPTWGQPGDESWNDSSNYSNNNGSNPNGNRGY